MFRFVSMCAACLKTRSFFSVCQAFPSATTLIYTGLIAVLLGFGGLPVEAETLDPNSTQSTANSDPLSGTLEVGQESTDLEVELMAADGAGRISDNPPTANAVAGEKDASKAPMLLRRWIYPWP